MCGSLTGKAGLEHRRTRLGKRYRIFAPTTSPCMQNPGERSAPFRSWHILAVIHAILSLQRSKPQPLRQTPNNKQSLIGLHF